MNELSAVWPAAARALAAGVLASWGALRVVTGLRGHAVPGLVALAVTPPLLPGYAYSSTAWMLIHRPVAAELLYVALLAARSLPAAVLASWLVGPRVRPAALHCWRLLGPRRSLATGLLIALGGPWGLRAAIALAVGVLAFGDLELASLLGRPSWTVALHDAQAGGLPVAHTLGRAVPPVAVLLAALASALALARMAMAPAGEPPPASRADRWAGAAVLAAALLAYLGLPLFAVLRDALPAPALAFRLARAVGQEIAVGAAFAGVAALLASSIARGLDGAPRLALLAALPGLVGALPLSLGVLAAGPALGPLRDGALPLLAAQVLLLLPVALLLDRVAARSARQLAPAQALCRAPAVAQRRAGRWLAWQLDGRARRAGFVVLFGLAYGELPASTVLAPVGLQPITTVLYNQAHYGRSAGLSAAMLAALLAPLALAALAAALRPRRP